MRGDRGGKGARGMVRLVFAFRGEEVGEEAGDDDED